MSTNKYALITGASSGIGKACALALLNDGWHVGLTARRVEALNDTIAAAGAAGSRALALPCDIGDSAAVAAAFATLQQKFGRLDRSSMGMEALTKKYSDRLAQGVVPPDRFTPAPVRAEERAKMVADGQEALEGMIGALAAWTEADLDAYMCPHPAMGPLTTREMVMFTVLHAEHHTRSVRRVADLS